MVVHGTQEGGKARDVLGFTYVCSLISLENLNQQVNGWDEGLDHWLLVRYWQRNYVALFFFHCNKEIEEECFRMGSYLYDGL